MTKWPFVALVSISTVAWLAIPPGLMPFREAPGDHVDADATKSRLAALARAKVFTGDSRATTATLPDVVSCRYVNKPVSGTTPKFDCTLDDGGKIRVKYGSDETKGEVAATWLLATLGFGADDVTRARRLRCYGCPRWPYQTRQISERLHLEPVLEDRIDYTRYTDFESVSVEHRDRQYELEFDEQEGWGFHELSAIDPSLGGATRAEVDALRLIAIFLNHWDNKASNQSLVCPGLASCEHPVALIQDVGSTFGPKKVNLDAWRDSPVWADAASCAVSMRDMPYDGGTFAGVQISEEGRRLLAGKLRQLTGAAAREMFSSAGFNEIDEWVAAFDRRADQIVRRPPCPS